MLGHWGISLKGSLPLPLPQLSQDEQISSTTSSSPCYSARNTDSKAMKVRTMESNPWRSELKKSFLFLSWLSCIFCHSKWAHSTTSLSFILHSGLDHVSQPVTCCVIFKDTCAWKRSSDLPFPFYLLFHEASGLFCHILLPQRPKAIEPLENPVPCPPQTPILASEQVFLL